MFRRYQLMLFLVLLFGAEWAPSAYAEINDVSIGGVVQSQPDSEAQLVSKRAREGRRGRMLGLVVGTYTKSPRSQTRW